MGRPIRIEFPGALYHVTSRGNERGLTNQAKSDFFGGVHYSAVSQAAARFANKLEKNTDLKIKIDEIMSNVKA